MLRLNTTTASTGAMHRSSCARSAAPRPPMVMGSTLRRQRDVMVQFTHRAEQLTDLAKEFGAAWAAQAFDKVEQLCAEDVRITSKHPLGCISVKGVDMLRQRLADTHAHQARAAPASSAPAAGKTPVAGAMGATPDVPAEQQARVLLAAADEQSDTAFCLLQLPPSKVSAAVPHAGDAGPAHVLLKMDIMLDDVSRCVAAVTERAQLPASLACLPDDQLSARQLARQQQRAPPFPAHLVKQWAALQAAGASGARVQRARVHSHGDKRMGPGSELHERVHCVLSAWLGARDTGTDTQALLDEAGCGPDFALLDAFGMVPLLCQPVPEAAGMPARDAKHSGKSAQMEPEVGGGAGAVPSGAKGEEESARATLMEQGKARAEVARRLAMRAERGELTEPLAAAADDVACLAVGGQVLQLFEATKGVYDVDCKVLDCAVCLDESAAFTHWKATQRNRVTGVQCDIEGMEVDLLDPATGALKAVYLFRDLMDFEVAMMEA